MERTMETMDKAVLSLLPTPTTYTGVKTYEQYMETHHTDKK